MARLDMASGFPARVRIHPRSWPWSCAGLFLLLLSAACASVPKQRYGIEKVTISGTQQLVPEAILPCMVTREREKLELGLGALGQPQCGQPPFDKRRFSWRMFAWFWTTWPVYDEAVLRLDLKRVERWYQARGYYGARVLEVDLRPQAAEDTDVCSGDDCKLSVDIKVEEGSPVRIQSIDLDGDQNLAPTLRANLREALGEKLTVGAVFDEAQYAAARDAMALALREEGYAKAKIEGKVRIHRGLLSAKVHFDVTPGPVCEIGEIRITSSSPVPMPVIEAVHGLKRGQRYHESDIEDAQRAIYALGAFSAVVVSGDVEAPSDQVDVKIQLEPRRTQEVLLGGGIMSGVLAGPALETISVPQWDLHLSATYEHRNFFGGLRRLRLEERPRLLFLGQFPQVPSNSPRFGNLITGNFSQPGVIEARTTLFVETSWDHGPDPFMLFFRDNVGLAVGLTRGFFEQRLNIRLAVHQDILHVDKLKKQYVLKQEIQQATPEELMDGSIIPKSYLLSFFEEQLTLDLRDDPVNPSKGAYFGFNMQEAVKIFDRSWNYVRLYPDARGYAPLGLGIVLAGRFALGSTHIFSFSPQLDTQSQQRGPVPYRLRGGGANSNRGFNPGQLGAGIDGGIRRWEASLELRVPLAKSFSIVFFSDMGDVNAAPRFRFDNMNTAVGAGLRYRTLIGPLRLDVGVRPKNLQGHVPADEVPPPTNLGFMKFNGAIALTIGEAF
ncbi:MAG: BamA/TamA family outer membrane protein [Myxococcales bacterium]